MPPAKGAGTRPRTDLRAVDATRPARLEPDPAPAPPAPAAAKPLDLTKGKLDTPLGRAPIIPVLLIGIGGYLTWFGVHYWRQDVKWPSDPIKSVLQGNGLPASTPPPAVSTELAADVQQYQTASPAAASTGTSSSGSDSAYQGTLPAGAAQNTAKLLLSKYGWALTEMAPLITLWAGESGWSPTARNPSSGAYGIAQALGHGTSGSAAPDGTNEYGPQYGLTDAEAQQANAGSVRWQIEWGLGYIKERYKSPTAALKAWLSRSPHWY